MKSFWRTFLSAFVIVTSGIAYAKTVLPFTFDQALSEMTAQHSTVLVQKTKVESSEVNLSANKLALLPTISASGSQQPSSSTPGNPPVNSIGAQASVNIFKGGADIASIDAAEKDKDFQTLTLDQTTLDAETSNAQVLLAQIQAQLQLTVLKKYVDSFKTELDIAHQRYQKGLLPQQEVDKVRIDYDNAEAKFQDAEAQANTAQADLLRLLGHDHVVLAWPWKERLQKPSVRKLIEHEVSLTQRPDYEAAVALSDAENFRSKKTFRTIFPALDFTFSQGYSQYLGQPLTSNGSTYVLSLTLFNAFQDYSAYKTQLTNQMAADYKLAQLKRDDESLSRAIQENFEVSLKTALARDRTLEISQRLYESNLLRLKQGRASANELVLDQQRLTDAELLALSGWSDAHLAFVKLCHVHGRLVANCE